jgi:hypothetical protein
MFSQREVLELFAYVQERPIDDESNYQMPIAALHARLFNVNRDPEKSRAMTMNDMLIFRRKGPEEELELGESPGW